MSAVLTVVLVVLAVVQFSSGSADSIERPRERGAEASSRGQDRDRDRLPDWWERSNGFSTRRGSARLDPDRDGLSNRSEYIRRLDPRRSDTDRDGLADRPEITVAGTDPRKRSTVYVDRDSLGGACSDVPAPGAGFRSTPWCSLEPAVAGAPEGTAVLIRRGRYPALELEGVGRESMVTLLPYEGERVELEGVRLREVGALRLWGLRMTGRVALESGCSQIDILRNDISPQGVSVRAGVRDVRIVDNRIHDLTYEGTGWGSGYGVWLSGGKSAPEFIRDVLVRGNRFERIPADAIQMGSVDGVRIERNTITGVQPFLDPSEHSDAIQMYGPGSDVTIRSNVMRDNAHTLIAKGFTYPRLKIENNLVADTSSGFNIYDAPGVRIVNNTVWRTVSFALRFSSLKGRMRDAIVANNIFDIMWFAPGDVAFEGYNLVSKPAPGTPYANSDILGVSPGFVSPSAIGEGLARGSAAIDAGVRSYATRRDRLGRRRDGRPDLGAQESR